MINRRFAAAACVTGIAALVVPAGMASAGPVASGGVKVAAKNAVAAKMSGFKVSGAAKASAPGAKPAKPGKVSP